MMLDPKTVRRLEDIFQRARALACLAAALLLVTLAASPAGAQAQRFEFEVPAGPLFLPCLGESIQGVFSGIATTHVRGSSNGGFRVTENLNVGGLFVGLTSGIEWTAHGASNFRFTSQGEQLNVTNVETIILVSPGGHPNVQTKFHQTLVVNANGVVSRNYTAVSFECVGEGAD